MWVGIWDCALENAAWQTAAVWQRLAKIRATSPIVISPRTEDFAPHSTRGHRLEIFAADGRILRDCISRPACART